jgi:DNA-binding beta-propeller fold protein YncE
MMMRLPRFLGVLTLGITSATVVGCTGAGSVSAPILQPSGPFKHGSAPRADRGRSWMAPDAKKQDLLYVSDGGTNDVYVFSYPKGKPLGTLTGFEGPEGECVDKAGDVFIINSNSSEILEYAHAGTSPIATLSDPGYYPTGCSIDPTTGNLAVTNGETTGSRAGSLAIYADAQGNPSITQIGDFYYYFFCGYDNEGNLFIDGLNSDFQFQFAELPKGSYNFRHISLSQSFEYAGGVQWDGKYVAVGDSDAGVIYQVDVTPSSATIVGSTTLEGSSPIYTFWITGHGGKKNPQGTKVVGARSAGSGNVMIWKYPAGGSATKTITGFTQPFGTTVSAAKK